MQFYVNVHHTQEISCLNMDALNTFCPENCHNFAQIKAKLENKVMLVWVLLAQ